VYGLVNGGGVAHQNKQILGKGHNTQQYIDIISKCIHKFYMHMHTIGKNHSGTLVAAVLTATSHFYGNSRNSTPTKSKPLNRLR